MRVDITSTCHNRACKSIRPGSSSHGDARDGLVAVSPRQSTMMAGSSQLFFLLACILCCGSAQRNTTQLGSCDAVSKSLDGFCPGLIHNAKFVEAGRLDVLRSSFRCQWAMCSMFPANGRDYDQGTCLLLLGRECLGNVSDCCNITVPGMERQAMRGFSFPVDSCVTRH